MEAIFNYINYLNGNKFFWGVTMLLLNFGSRYVIGDLGKLHEQILGNEIVKKIITFSLFFVATRDVTIAFVLTILYVIIVDGLLHEKRKFCIVPNAWKGALSAPTGVVVAEAKAATTEDYLRAKEIINTYEMQENKQDKKIYELYKDAVLSL
jgi:uncharacterized membrane protein (DUF485 family)